jgi:hypothetical protein
MSLPAGTITSPVSGWIRSSAAISPEMLLASSLTFSGRMNGHALQPLDHDVGDRAAELRDDGLALGLARLEQFYDT